MSFVKADLNKEKEKLDKLVAESEEARKAHEEFLSRIALQQKLIDSRKAEKMTQSDVANASGLSQQAYMIRAVRGAAITTAEEIDVLKTMMMVLCHDLVEVYAGDTFAYDEAAKQSKQQREKKAADRLFGLLPEDQNQKIRSLWEEFEEAKTPEALFAHTMDNLQPTMLNAAAGGISWKEWGVHIDQILERNKLTGKGYKDLWNYSYSCLISPNVENGNIKK